MDVFVGMIMPWPMDWAPVDWLPCDGRTLPINGYEILYSLLGNKYGGDGVSTFALPDLRGRTMVGFGAGPGLTPRNIGDKGGSETVTLSVDSMPAHSHVATFTPGGSGGSTSATLQASSAQGTTSSADGNYLANGYNPGDPGSGTSAASVNNYIEPANAGPLSAIAGLSVSGAGSGGAVTLSISGQGRPAALMPPFATVNYIIATNGYYPERP